MAMRSSEITDLHADIHIALEQFAAIDASVLGVIRPGDPWDALRTTLKGMADVLDEMVEDIETA